MPYSIVLAHKPQHKPTQYNPTHQHHIIKHNTIQTQHLFALRALYNKAQITAECHTTMHLTKFIHIFNEWGFAPINLTEMQIKCIPFMMLRSQPSNSVNFRHKIPSNPSKTQFFTYSMAKTHPD
jgi:hypothetical protein